MKRSRDWETYATELEARLEHVEAERDNWRAAYYAAKDSYQSYVERLEAVLEGDDVKATERIPERIEGTDAQPMHEERDPAS